MRKRCSLKLPGTLAHLCVVSMPQVLPLGQASVPILHTCTLIRWLLDTLCEKRIPPGLFLNQGPGRATHFCRSASATGTIMVLPGIL